MLEENLEKLKKRFKRNDNIGYFIQDGMLFIEVIPYNREITLDYAKRTLETIYKFCYDKLDDWGEIAIIVSDHWIGNLNESNLFLLKKYPVIECKYTKNKRTLNI